MRMGRCYACTLAGTVWNCRIDTYGANGQLCMLLLLWQVTVP
jgi:hypothetical protein